jgi:homotetrameric cytidine deaminase
MNDASSTETSLLNLLGHACQAALHAYAPYSGFRVGAAVRLTSGEIVTGTNVENVSYGLTICAERSALVRAVSQFGADIRIEAVAIANLNDAPSPPCGACRQVLGDFPGHRRRPHHVLQRTAPAGLRYEVEIGRGKQRPVRRFLIAPV